MACSYAYLYSVADHKNIYKLRILVPTYSKCVHSCYTYAQYVYACTVHICAPTCNMYVHTCINIYTV